MIPVTIYGCSFGGDMPIADMCLDDFVSISMTGEAAETLVLKYRSKDYREEEASLLI